MSVGALIRSGHIHDHLAQAHTYSVKNVSIIIRYRYFQSVLKGVVFMSCMARLTQKNLFYYTVLRINNLKHVRNCV
ncbi:hypothetical protein Hanom_Chr03g00241831 [Helianthus anomalus]